MKRRHAFLAEPPAGPPVTAAYEEDIASDGYVNNATRVWCWRPDVLASFQTLRGDLMAASDLSPREVAVMVAATAAARGDSYCALAWGARLAELSDEVTAANVLRAWLRSCPIARPRWRPGRVRSSTIPMQRPRLT